MKGQPTIVLDTRRMTTTGENANKYPAKLRVSFRVGSRYVHRFYPTGVYATDSTELMKIQTSPRGDGQRKQQTVILNFLEKAKALLADQPGIDPESFGGMMTTRGNFKDPLGMMEANANELRQAGDIGNADYYDQACSSFRKYANKFLHGSMTFGMVTARMLFKYEKWMLEQGLSITTVGMYCRAMRRVFKIAIGKKIIPPTLYPFGEGENLYQIPTASGRKLALDEGVKDKVLKYATLNPTVRWAVDMWIFSYFCQGMNGSDIARLKYRHIEDDVLRFERFKSRRKRNKKPIEAIIRPEVREIISRHGNKSLDPSEYIFPILREGLSEQQAKDRIHDFIADVNEGLKTACEEMGIPKITTYWARHTFATILKRKGATTEQIQEALGHADKKTTESYLDSFDLDTKRKMAGML